MAPITPHIAAREVRSRPRGSAYEPVVGFQSAKAAQVAAFFVAKAGGRIEKLKLAKLAYLGEREHLRVYDAPITFDELYSLPHGPICSGALNGIDGKLHGRAEWRNIQSHGTDQVVGRREVAREELDELSESEIEVLGTVWEEFGRFTASQLRNWTHVKAHCPEYTEVGPGRRLAIAYYDLLKVLGKTDVAANAIVEDIAAFRRLENTLNR